MKRIISFSLWGKDPFYFKGAIENVKLQPEIYPGWTCRFYVDDTVPENAVKELKELGAEIYMMPRSDGNYGMFWRFSPLDDLDIERFIVRDTDCRLNIREADAVEEWIESDKQFHIMRDNVQHIMVPICGAMWGSKSGEYEYDRRLKEWLLKNQHRIFSHPRGKYFFIDQSFLGEVIWPLIINKHIAHESVKSKYPGLKKDFRIKNPDGTFVGEGINL